MKNVGPLPHWAWHTCYVVSQIDLEKITVQMNEDAWVISCSKIELAAGTFFDGKQIRGSSPPRHQPEYHPACHNQTCHHYQHVHTYPRRLRRHGSTSAPACRIRHSVYE